MKPFNPIFLSVLLGLGAILGSQSLLALASDREQPIYIESDSAERNEKIGITVYQGKVKMDQGSLRILADKITIHSIDNKISKIVAIGSPAHYQQQPSQDKQLVIAEGGSIKYEISTERLELLTNASIVQEGTTLTGDRIDYDMAKSLVKAAGNASSANQRIQMVIPPSKTETKTETETKTQ